MVINGGKVTNSVDVVGTAVMSSCAVSFAHRLDCRPLAFRIRPPKLNKTLILFNFVNTRKEVLGRSPGFFSPHARFLYRDGPANPRRASDRFPQTFQFPILFCRKLCYNQSINKEVVA